MSVHLLVRSLHRSAVRLTVLSMLLSFALNPSRLEGQRAAAAGAIRRENADTSAATRRPPDAFFGRDKVRHFGSSAAIQLVGYGALRTAGATCRTSVITASVITFGAGVGKELWDVRRGRQASWRDIVWNTAGLLAGTGLARVGDPR